ncbi:hypothetical protein [Mesorhizobium sp. SP-1A]|uniref:hypothetical protein n=1 Tax=Mesorhizobium sp. SP-1A TaxID=3077840 RepID=UPI0028F74767|nr:hypothetical protein [Mesorhizobium sp. SP-1A]
MPSPRYYLRLPRHQADELEALARHLDTSPALIIKLLVDRTLSGVAPLLADHDEQLEHIHLTIRDIARVHRDLMSDGVVATGQDTFRILEKLDEIASAIDSIRDDAFVRSYTIVKDLIAGHDEKPTQETLPV